MSGETETVSLNLDGSFESAAGAAADAGDKLADSLAGVGAAADDSTPKLTSMSASFDAMRNAAKLPPLFVNEEKRLSILAKEAERAKAAMDKLRAASKAAAGTGDGVSKGFGGKLPASLQASANAKPPGGFQQIVGAVNKLFGAKAAAGLVSGAARLTEASDKLKPFGPLLSAGSGLLKGAGGAVLAGGQMVLKAAAALLAAGTAVAAVGYKLAVAKSSQKEIQSAIFGQIGATDGFKVALKLAADFNLRDDDAIEKVKGLLSAKFAEKDIPALVRLAVGIGAVKGEDKAKSFIEKLEKINLAGKAKLGEGIEGMAESGLDVTEIYKNLAKDLGVSVAVAQAKVKAGQVDITKAIDAIKKSAGGFGDVADKLGNSVPALFNKLRIAGEQLFAFDPSALDPIKDALKNVLSVLEGGEGAELKDALKELFGALNDSILGQFKGEEGKKKIGDFIRTVASSLKDLAGAVQRARPVIEFLTDMGGAAIVGGIQLTKGVILELALAFDFLSGVAETASDVFDKLMLALGLASPEEQARQGGENIGNSLVDGLTTALLAGLAGGPIGAIMALVANVIAAGRTAADAHSPSRKMGALGDDMTAGLTDKLDAANDNAAKAGANLANAAVEGAGGGAAGGAAGRGGAAAAAGGGGPAVSITNHFAPGTTPAQAQALAAANAEEWRRQMRAWQREKGERAA